MRVLVVGGGISGLSLAHRLSKCANITVTLADQQPRVGGWLNTTLHGEHGQYMFEKGPRSLIVRRGSAWQLIELIKDLRMTEEVVHAAPDAFKRYVWSDKQRLQLLPTGLNRSLLGCPDLSLGSAAWAAMREPLRPVGTMPDESVADFITRRFSKHVLDQFVDPMVAGIYSGDPAKLSVRSCFKALWQAERDHGSVVTGMGKQKHPPHPLEQDPFFLELQKAHIYSFKRGMSALPSRLHHVLGEAANVRIRTGAQVSGLRVEAGKPIAVRVGNEEAEFEHMFCTGDTIATARLLQTAHCTDPAAATLSALTSLLGAVPYASLWTVNIAYRGLLLQQTGFGFLVPSKTGLEVLGVTFDSCAFPDQLPAEEKAQTTLTVMIGGGRHPWLAERTSQEIEEHALRHVRLCLGLTAEPEVVCVSLARHCIPQFPVGHHQTVERVHALTKDWINQTATTSGLSLLGPGLGGVSVPDCVSGAHAAADQLTAQM